MTRKLLLFILFLCLNTPYIFSQSIKENVNYTIADSIAGTVKYRHDIFKLTKELVSPFSQDLLKTRAIFKWITNNIRYDVRFYNKYHYKGKEPKTYRCKDDKDCEAKRITLEIKRLNKTLRRKKAVCEGYAKLFKKMCDIAGIRSQFVEGYIRTEYYQVGTAGTMDHAWNTVFIDSAYYTLDATWAAGGCTENEDGKLLKYFKHFNKYYWLTPAAAFARNHYPLDNQWVLLPNYTKDIFSANPYYAQTFLPELTLLSPASGIIEAKQGDTIHFKIDYTGSFEKLQINSNLFRNPDIWTYEKVRRKTKKTLDTIALKKQQYIAYKKHDSLYEFDYVVPDNSLYYLEILFDRERAMRFKLITPQL